MPNNCLSVLYKHIIQVENKNVGLKVGGHKHTIAPPIKKVGGHMPPLPPPLPTPVPKEYKSYQQCYRSCTIQELSKMLSFLYNTRVITNVIILVQYKSYHKCYHSCTIQVLSQMLSFLYNTRVITNVIILV